MKFDCGGNWDCSGNWDCHVHTDFSIDSSEPMERHCERAVALGLTGLCFTEHVDFDAPSRDYYKPEAYFEALYRLREKFAGRLEILAGLEFPEPHQHQKELEQAQKRPYDFILGSVHYWLGELFPSQMLELNMDISLCFARYWEHMLLMARCGGFDSVAHFDFPKRYFKTLQYEPGQVDEIFRAMLKNNLALEINTSSLRKGLEDTLPGEDLLLRYVACGGHYVTLGSDAHQADELYADVEGARIKAETLGLEAVRFVKRVRTKM